MKTRAQEKKGSINQSPQQKENEMHSENSNGKQTMNNQNSKSDQKNISKSDKKDNNFLSVEFNKKESLYKSPNLSPQQIPENVIKSPSAKQSVTNSPSLKSPIAKSPQSSIKGTLSPDPFRLDNNGNNSTAKEIKIENGSFVQKNDIKIDDYLSHFEPKVKLGDGYYAEVYKIKSKEKGYSRAMKIIKKKKIPFSEVQQLLREIKILKKLDHPNILKLYEFLEDDENYYLITELCEGKDLFSVIEDNYESLTEKDVASIVQQILQSLAYAHANKIMHRDIKPENIMVSVDEKKNYHLKLLDWGMGSDYGSYDSTSTQKCGTPAYVAPEVIKKKYNEKCDVWSTGVILYTLLVQEVPFYGNSTTDQILSVLKGQYDMKGEDWDKVSCEAKCLVKQMLNYDYETRISAEEALKHPWFKQVSQKLSKQVIRVNLSRLKQFQAQSQLQKAAMNFIVSHLVSEKEKEQFSELFKQLDENQDGQLSKTEIMNGYKKVYGKNISEEEVNKIFDQIDVNKSGFIDYTEFITAAIDVSVFTENEKLQEAFRLFDKDGDGFITEQEIQSVLGVGTDIDTEVWSNIIAEVDENGDGQVSFEEFKKIMQNLVKHQQDPKRKQGRKKSTVMVDENQKQ